MIPASLTTLLVEDSTADARLVSELLAQVADGPNTLEVVETLARALDRLRGPSPPDVVLLDLNLPDAQGLGALAELNAPGFDSPVIVLSGLSDASTIAQAAAIGADDYLIKGRFDADSLGRTIRYALERRRASSALRNSEKRYRLLHESMRDAFLLVDMSGKILETNRAFQEMVGYGAEELLRLTYRDITPPSWRAFEDRIVAEEILPLGHSRIYEKEYRHKDGTVFPVELHANLLSRATGEPEGMFAIVRDITIRKRAEADLRLQSLLLTTQQEASIDGILVVDADSQIISFNQRFIELWSIPPEMVKDRADGPVLEFVSHSMADRGPFLERVKYLYDHPKETGRDEITLRDGRTFDRYSAPMFGWDEHYYGRVWYFRDITERKRAEESRTLLATAVEQAAETIMITDSDGTILYANPAFERTSGYPCEEAIGQTPRILKSGKHDAEFYRQMWSVLRKGHVWTGHLSNKRSDGTFFEEDATISPVRNSNEHIVNYVAVKRDVTIEMALADQLFQAQKMEAVGRLAGGIAHDFNNLLAVIIGYGDIVHRHLADDDVLRLKVANILKAADRATALTRQLLAFGRKQILQPRILDLNAVVSDMETMLRRLIREDVELATRLDPDLGNVMVDPGQIEQVLMNLAVNACDAMPEGGRLIIETQNAHLSAADVATHATTPAGSYVMLAVSDTGTGMDEATRTRAFEPFFTTKEVGKGTGLGLSSVYGTVTQSGGHIWVNSEVGVGSTFRVFLPRLDDEVAQPTQVHRDPPPRGDETVLLVEDDVSLRDLLLETLEAHGYSVLVARDGADALHIAAAHPGPIGVMVTDVVMPGMAGPKVVELIAPTRPQMKVLYVSGYSEEAVARHSLGGPGRTFIRKPFAPEILLRKIREALDAD